MLNTWETLSSKKYWQTFLDYICMDMLLIIGISETHEVHRNVSVPLLGFCVKIPYTTEITNFPFQMNSSSEL